MSAAFECRIQPHIPAILLIQRSTRPRVRKATTRDKHSGQRRPTTKIIGQSATSITSSSRSDIDSPPLRSADRKSMMKSRRRESKDWFQSVVKDLEKTPRLLRRPKNTPSELEVLPSQVKHLRPSPIHLISLYIAARRTKRMEVNLCFTPFDPTKLLDWWCNKSEGNYRVKGEKRSLWWRISFQNLIK